MIDAGFVVHPRRGPPCADCRQPGGLSLPVLGQAVERLSPQLFAAGQILNLAREALGLAGS
jgi:hypothetical protein